MMWVQFARTFLRLGLVLVIASSICGQERPKRPGDVTPAQAETQDVSPDDVVRISTNLVQFDAVVTDRKGHSVTNLRPEDFQLRVNGKLQPIEFFSFVTLKGEGSPMPLPVATKKGMPPPPNMRANQVGRTFALVLDDAFMSKASVNTGRKLLRKFVDEMQPNDVAAIISTFSGTGTLQQFTADKRQLYATIDRLHWRPNRKEETLPTGTSSTSTDDSAMQMANIQTETDAYNRSLSAGSFFSTVGYVTRGLRDLPGRKSIVILSDGLDLNAGELQDRMRLLVEKANRASAVIYTIHLLGLDTLWFDAAEKPETRRTGFVFDAKRGPMSRRREEFYAGQAGLIAMAERTGGFNVRNTNGFPEAMQRVSEDQSGYYLIGYRPDEATFDPRRGPQHFNSLKVTLKGHDDLQLRSRNGFLGVEEKRSAPAKRSASQQLIAALQSPAGTDGIRLRLTSLFTNEPRSGSSMRSLLHLDARDLTFSQKDGGDWLANIDVVAVTMGIDGAMASEVTKNQTIRVSESKYQQFLQDGLIYEMDLPVKKAGGYELRIAVRDAETGKLGSAREFVEVPNLENNSLALSGLVVSGRELNQTNKTSQSTDDLTTAYGPAVRRFHRGMMLDYGLVIYNATAVPGKGLPVLTTETHLYRDGQEILVGKPQSVSAQQQRDLRRITTGGSVKLDERLQPGWYSFEVVVTDALANKGRTASRWVDFEIVQ